MKVNLSENLQNIHINDKCGYVRSSKLNDENKSVKLIEISVLY
ncbi:MAG: hypothetical protein PWQ82_136 [Thermosediminibacterales bacterium]|nr:hypothetical protein [Thermosediminibacterales bacterium]MDK2835301.1 hypothetical protein [Thermosediminibacterales bacterium]